MAWSHLTHDIWALSGLQTSWSIPGKDYWHKYKFQEPVVLNAECQDGEYSDCQCGALTRDFTSRTQRERCISFRPWCWPYPILSSLETPNVNMKCWAELRTQAMTCMKAISHSPPLNIAFSIYLFQICQKSHSAHMSRNLEKVKSVVKFEFKERGRYWAELCSSVVV